MYYSMTSYIVVNYASVPIPVVFFKYSIMYVCMSVFFLSVSLSLSVCLILIGLFILRNQAPSFDGVIPFGSLPLYF